MKKKLILIRGLGHSGTTILDTILGKHSSIVGIGEGIRVDQTTNTIRGRDFSKAIQAEVTPLILALR